MKIINGAILLIVGFVYGAIFWNEVAPEPKIPNPMVYTVKDIEAGDTQDFEVLSLSRRLVIRPKYYKDKSVAYPIEIQKVNGEVRVLVYDINKKAVSVRVTK